MVDKSMLHFWSLKFRNEELESAFNKANLHDLVAQYTNMRNVMAATTLVIIIDLIIKQAEV